MKREEDPPTRRKPGGGGGSDLLHMPPDGIAPHLVQAHAAHLSADDPLNKDHNAIQPGHPRAVSGIAVNGELMEAPLCRALIHGGSVQPGRQRRG